MTQDRGDRLDRVERYLEQMATNQVAEQQARLKLAQGLDQAQLLSSLALNQESLQTTVQQNATAIGQLQQTVQQNATAIGQLQQTVQQNATAIGQLQQTVQQNATAIGQLQQTVQEQGQQLQDSVSHLIGVIDDFVEDAQQDRQAIRDEAERDRQQFQSEIRRIWEYLLGQSSNGRRGDDQPNT